MANYPTHSTINLLIALPVAILAAAMGLGVAWNLIVIGAVVFTYGTLFMTPDVDLAHQIKLRSLRGVLSFPFRLYSKVFHHRGLSHSFLFGTLTRILWLGLPTLAILYFTYRIHPTDRAFIAFLKRYQWPFVAGFIGLFLADTCHLIIDKIWDLRGFQKKKH